MILISPDRRTYRGNLHMHTTRSDGHLTPGEAMARYREMGYDFVAITDHRTLTVPEKKDIPEGLLWIPGIELDWPLEGQVVHIVGLNVTDRAEKEFDRRTGVQGGIDLIRSCGGLAELAHPAWSLNTTELICSLSGIFATEIWNSASTVPMNAMRADSSAVLDPVFTRGMLWPVLSVDDTHEYKAECGVGATMVQADVLDAHGILQGICEGHSYATTGPEIHLLEAGGGEVHVRCSSDAALSWVVFYSNLPYTHGRAVPMEGKTEAVWKLHEGETFIRVQAADARGRSAWSNPISREIILG
ncbi:MAG: CehA/McbA family metallohydrolase [Clostridia bacterium]|nr:CehA/McbA family metallohydrolase [Clostridia bacterium]